MPTKAVLDLSKIESAGSGRGWHYYLRWLGCARRASLIESVTPARLAEVTPDYFTVGTVLHKLLEIHESNAGYQDIVFKNTPPKMQTAVDEAWEIFRHYRAYYTPGWWGRVIARELREKMRFGGSFDFTGQIDLVLKIQNEHHIQRWYEAGVVVTKGTYIADYKSYTPPWNDDNYRDSPQFTGYHQLAENAFLARRLDGTLIIGINKVEKKAPPVRGLLIPPPGARQLRIWQQQIQLAIKRRAEMPIVPNLAQCGYGRDRCPFFMHECNLEF